MDQHNLIHPMTAGDLVESAVFLTAVPSPDGRTDIHRHVVAAVELETETPSIPLPPDTRIRVTAVDRQTQETTRFIMKASTPLLVTDISL